jgi:hypothetical protein
LEIPSVVGAPLMNRLRAELSIAIPMSRIFPVGVESLMLLAEVDVRLLTVRSVRREDFLIEIFPIDRLARRSVLRVRRSMKI